MLSVNSKTQNTKNSQNIFFKNNINKNKFFVVQCRIKKLFYLRKTCSSISIIFFWIILEITKRNKVKEEYMMNYNRTQAIKEASKFSEFCIKGDLFDKKKYKKVKKPYISIIIPVYNREKFLLTTLNLLKILKIEVL